MDRLTVGGAVLDRIEETVDTSFTAGHVGYDSVSCGFLTHVSQEEKICANRE